jgi:hypothetical protein
MPEIQMPATLAAAPDKLVLSVEVVATLRMRLAVERSERHSALVVGLRVETRTLKVAG